MPATLLLLSVFLYMGVRSMGSTDGSIRTVEYGNDFNIRFYSQPESIKFLPRNSSTLVVIWKEGDILMTINKKYLLTNMLFIKFKVTQNDSGDYIVKYKGSQDTSTYSLDVKESAKIYKRKQGDSLRVLSGLETESCNIYYFPETPRIPSQSKYEIVGEGRLQEAMAHLGCSGFDMMDPCGISNKELQLSCSGRYEFRDQDGNLALRVTLKVEAIRRTFKRKAGGAFSFSLNVEPKSCNIYLIPKSSSGWELNLVSKGMLLPGLDKYDCTGFEMEDPCGLSNQNLKMSCRGLYEIRDHNGNTTLEASLEMESTEASEESYESTYIGVGSSGAIAAFLCACLKYCCWCCGKGCFCGDGSEAAAAPDDNQECAVELNGVRSEGSLQPGTEIPHHPCTDVPPSYNQIPHYPDTDMLPSYNQVSAPAASTQASTDSYVYTSETHNFL